MSALETLHLRLEMPRATSANLMTVERGKCSSTLGIAVASPKIAQTCVNGPLLVNTQGGAAGRTSRTVVSCSQGRAARASGIRHSVFQFRDCSTQATTENQLKHRNLKTSLKTYLATSLPQGERSGNLDTYRNLGEIIWKPMKHVV